MSQRDSFVRRDATRGPQRQAPAVDRTAPSSDPALLQEARTLVEQATAAIEGLGPAMDILARGCAQAFMPVPGVPEHVPRYRPPPGADLVAGYLATHMPQRPELARAVQVAVYRFHQAREAIRAGAAASTQAAVAPVVLERIRQQLYLLGHLHDDFKKDAVIGALFAPPKVVQRATVGLPPPPPRPTPAQLMAVARARSVVASLQPHMAVVERVLGVLDPLGGAPLRDLLTPEGRRARLVALALPGRPELLERVRKLPADLAALVQALEGMKDGPPPKEVAELTVAIVAIVDDCRAHAVIKELFPATAPMTIQR